MVRAGVKGGCCVCDVMFWRTGIRVISMLWVILGHALAIAPSAYVNSELVCMRQ
jgi:hypothetical protein